MTLYKRDNFFFLFKFFLETKMYMWTILTSKCVWLCLFFNVRIGQHYGHDILWPQQYIGHDGLYHAELSMDSFILTLLWYKLLYSSAKLDCIQILNGQERLSFKYSVQKTTFNPVLFWKGWKLEPVEFAATTPGLSLQPHWQTMMNMWWNQNLTYQCVCSSQVESHSLYINIGPRKTALTALIPLSSCYLSSVSRSLSLIGDIETETLFKRCKISEPWPVHRIGWRSMCEHGCAYSDRLSGMLLFIKILTPSFSRTHMQTHTYTDAEKQICLTEASGTAVLTENPG